MESPLETIDSVMTNLRAFADNLPQLAWIADRDGSVSWCNRRWRDYTGARLRDAREWDWLQFVRADHAERVEKRLRGSVHAGEDWEDTLPLRRADGAYQWFLSRAVPFRDDSGAIERWYGTTSWTLAACPSVSCDFARARSN
jgi:PAS domain S-box-containing protein